MRTETRRAREARETRTNDRWPPRVWVANFLATCMSCGETIWPGPYFRRRIKRHLAKPGHEDPDTALVTDWLE